MKEIAYEYWKQGHAIVAFNITEEGKKPLVEWKRWIEGEQSEEQFNSQPWDRANAFGLVCGRKLKNGLYLVVVDFDVKNVSEEARQLGDKAFKLLPITKLEETPSGGKHNVYLTRMRASTRNYHNDCALELLGAKKLCVMAPSLGYKKLNDNTPTVVGDVEDEFFRVLKGIGIRLNKKPWFNWTEQVGEEYHGRTPPCIKALSRGTEEGNRNEHGIRLASYLINFVQGTPRFVKDRMNEWNRRNNPPLQRKELEKLIGSTSRGGYIYGCNDPILKKLCKRKSCNIAPYIMVKLLDETERKEAVKVLADPNLMKYVADYGNRELIGEDGALIENFVEICSGQTRYAISGMKKGFSGSGKNLSVRAVLPLIPEEWVYAFTTATAEAIKYLPKAFKGTLIIYEAASVRSETGSLGLRAVGESKSIETIYPIRDDTTGEMTLGSHTTNARNFITTDAGVGIEPQLYRRVLQRSMNSGPALTRRVMAKKIRDFKTPLSLKRHLGTLKKIPYSQEQFRNALRLNEWNVEVIVLGGEELMKLTEMAVNREQEVALRTHIEKILSFVCVVALINQKNRVRVVVNDKTAYVLASPEDWFLAISVLESTIFETIARLGKRQQDVLELVKSEGVTKHDVAKDLGVSTYTAARALKVLANNGYLKEFKNTKPYRYEPLRKQPEPLSILQNTSEFRLFWLEEYQNWLNSTFATLQARIHAKILGAENAEKQWGIPICKGVKVRLTPKPKPSGITKQATFRYSETPSETDLKTEKSEE